MTSIGKYAFYECESLTSVTIPDSVSSIGKRAFSKCKKLKSINNGSNVTSIGEDAFKGTKWLANKWEFVFVIGNTVLIKYNGWSDEIVFIPDGVTSIADGAFSDCHSLSSITIPDSVTSIGDRAFNRCQIMDSVTIGSGLTSIDHIPYYDLKEIIVSPDNMHLMSIDNVVYDKSCKKLLACVGKKNSGLTIPDSVTSIGSWAFSGRSCKMTSLTIGKGLTSVDGIPFGRLEEIVVSPDNMNLMSIDNVVYDKSGTILLGCAGKKAGEFTIPDVVTTIGDNAFDGCTSLTSITISDSVTSIGESAFSGCKSLTSVTIPDSVTSVGNRAFFACKSLTSITIPDSVTSIGNSTFNYCESLTSVAIPDSVTSIGVDAFEHCWNLTSVTIGNSVTSIGYGAFYKCESLTSVTIGNSVTSIGESAFSGCKSLTSVTIPDSVSSIGDRAFEGCKKIKIIRVCGVIVDITQVNFEKVEATDVITMLKNMDYSVKMDHPTKYRIVAQVFLKDGQPEAEAYIKKNITKILPFFIDINDYETVKVLLESGKFVTKRNIMKFVDYAIDNTQKGGDMQIQVLIMNYRNEHFPDIDPLKSFKL